MLIITYTSQEICNNEVEEMLKRRFGEVARACSF